MVEPLADGVGTQQPSLVVQQVIWLWVKRRRPRHSLEVQGDEDLDSFHSTRGSNPLDGSMRIVYALAVLFVTMVLFLLAIAYVAYFILGVMFP